jgi:hypothetical protein
MFLQCFNMTIIIQYICCICISRSNGLVTVEVRMSGEMGLGRPGMISDGREPLGSVHIGYRQRDPAGSRILFQMRSQAWPGLGASDLAASVFPMPPQITSTPSGAGSAFQSACSLGARACARCPLKNAAKRSYKCPPAALVLQ